MSCSAAGAAYRYGCVPPATAPAGSRPPADQPAWNPSILTSTQTAVIVTFLRVAELQQTNVPKQCRVPDAGVRRPDYFKRVAGAGVIGTALAGSGLALGLIGAVLGNRRRAVRLTYEAGGRPRGGHDLPIAPLEDSVAVGGFASSPPRRPYDTALTRSFMPPASGGHPG